MSRHDHYPVELHLHLLEALQDSSGQLIPQLGPLEFNQEFNLAYEYLSSAFLSNLCSWPALHTSFPRLGVPQPFKA